MSTYFPNIPEPTDNPSDSQAQLQSNFQALNNAISRNHIAMTDTSNSGKHEFLQMPEQAVPPTTISNEGGVYTKDVGGNTQLFYREESNGKELQLTNSFSGTSNGSFTLPGGLFYQWGVENSVTNLSTVTFPTPFVAVPFNVQLQIIQDSTASNIINVRNSGLTNTAFQVSTTAGALKIFWLAIGLI